MFKQFEGFAEKDMTGFVQPDCEYTEQILDSVSRCGIGYLSSVNLITDSFRHVPKGKSLNGVRLSYTKRGVLLNDSWMGGGMELFFRSMRTARVYAKSWTTK